MYIFFVHNLISTYLCNLLTIKFLDFQNFVINTLTHIKYDISGLINVNQLTHGNVECLLQKQNNDNISKTISGDGLDVQALFPITNETELATIETKILDANFRSSLVQFNKITL